VAARRKKPAAGQGGGLRVTWVHSEIGHKAAARGTIQALGLHRLHQTVEIPDTPVNRGMIRRVAFLLAVEEPSAGGTAPTTEEGHETS
jgi:large subunit ribosomal protein L30